MSDEHKAVMIAEGQIQDPKSPMGSYELPCGWVEENGQGSQVITDVTVREFSGVEEDILASDKMNNRQKMDSLLSNCVVSIGNIQERERIPKIVSSMRIGDRVFLLLAIRRTTLGDIYPYIAICPSCGKKDLYTVDLREMRVKTMPDPTKSVYDDTLPNGQKVRWHVMTGDMEAKADNMPMENKKRDAVSLAILARLELLNDIPAGIHQVKALSLRDRNALRDMFEENEGGVDTSTSFECSSCGHDWVSDVDITQQGFFFPSAARRSWKRKSTL